uniref:vitamin-K-epoxide reductase (warfarin-sensitive) n=1 Tax=Ascaris lumbricoides TaxID=6252 RepID=A0A0M3HV46_ASCLU
MGQPVDAEQRKRFYDCFGAVTALVGLAVSVYSLYVEVMLDKYATNYEPMCDVNSLISCSKALHSPFGTGLGLVEHILGAEHFLNQKNALYGVVIYAVMVPLQLVDNSRAVSVALAMCVFMNALTVYLVLILVYLQVICPVCFAIYIINGVLLFVSMKRRRISDFLLSKKRA